VLKNKNVQNNGFSQAVVPYNSMERLKKDQTKTYEKQPAKRAVFLCGKYSYFNLDLMIAI
jgi:hypothetical protein